MTVYGLTSVKAAKIVQPRTLQPLVTPPHERSEPQGEAERWHERNPQGERRTYCRRSRHLPVLAELRSGLERRRHNQRAEDPTEHVDIEA
jgi:hypothetical protein